MKSSKGLVRLAKTLSEKQTWMNVVDFPEYTVEGGDSHICGIRVRTIQRVAWCDGGYRIQRRNASSSVFNVREIPPDPNNVIDSRSETLKIIRSPQSDRLEALVEGW
jgi:hypothetical protein